MACEPIPTWCFAVRETLEEAGIPVHVTGVIRIEYSPSPKARRAGG